MFAITIACDSGACEEVAARLELVKFNHRATMHLCKKLVGI